MTNNIGTVSQIIGPVVDVQFAEDKIPAIYNALIVDRKSYIEKSDVRQTTNDKLIL